jgi:ArsR family transcriptional regulator
MVEKQGQGQVQDEFCLSEAIDQTAITELARQMPETQTYGRMADLFKLLGDETRLRIVVALLHRDLCVHDLVALLRDPEGGSGKTQSAVSHQLRLMRAAQIVRAERQGQRVRYSLVDEHIRELVASSLAHAREE